MARGGSGKGAAAKLLPLKVLAVCAIGVVAYFICKPDVPDRPIKDSVAVAEPPTATVSPEFATIYLDNSVSMQGYVHGRQYLDALADLMSVYPRTEARCVGDSGEVIKTGSELIGKLTNKVV